MDKKWIVIAAIVVFILIGSRTVFAVKPGAILSNDPLIEHARRIVARVWQKYGYTLTITSGYEGQHSAQTLHVSGLAEDYRTRDITPTDLTPMITEVRAILGRDYDVVKESDHLHIEYDPK